MAENESLIIKKIVDGDHSAYEYVYKQYYSQLTGFASSFYSDEAHEIVQDVLLKVWENRADLQAINNLKGYLFQSVRNACLNFIKREEVKAKYQSHAAYELKQMELDAMLPEVDDPRKEELRKALDEIPEQRKKIFQLSFIEGHKAKDIGEQLGISERTVHTHVYNAMKFLKKKLLVAIPLVGGLFEGVRYLFINIIV